MDHVDKVRSTETENDDTASTSFNNLDEVMDQADEAKNLPSKVSDSTRGSSRDFMATHGYPKQVNSLDDLGF